ncbi:hypothetical protein VSQ48_16635 [Candidatus Ventrimonas sp. KK005]
MVLVTGDKIYRNYKIKDGGMQYLLSGQQDDFLELFRESKKTLTLLG